MKLNFAIALTVFILFHIFQNGQAEDRPCSPRDFGHGSVVCVCNATYCDDISKVEPLPAGSFVYYTSTMSGARFEKTNGTLEAYNLTHRFNNKIKESINELLNFRVTLEIDRSKVFQNITGFGGALTDSTAYKVLQLSPGAQENFINSYFSSKGLEYNMLRTTIGSSDFSLQPYAYNEFPEGDVHLTNFSLTSEDLKQKIPLIKRFMNASTSEILLNAVIWSPPLWMKSKKAWRGASSLKEEFYQTYADYHYKYVDEYKKAGLNTWSISTGNEPMTGLVASAPISTISWLPRTQAKWIAENFGPTFKNSTYSSIKIVAADELRYAVPIWLDLMSPVKEALKYIDGIAIHWYLNAVIPPSVLDRTHERYPDKFMIATEGSSGFLPWNQGVILGSWDRAEKYMRYVVEDLNHWIVGWIDWNIALDEKGGPNWVQNYVDSPVIVLNKTDEFLKQPSFYALGHFAKFIPRGSKRIEVQTGKGVIRNVAFLRPDGGVAVVMYNLDSHNKTVIIREKDKGAIQIEVPPRSFQTVLYW